MFNIVHKNGTKITVVRSVLRLNFRQIAFAAGTPLRTNVGEFTTLPRLPIVCRLGWDAPLHCQSLSLSASKIIFAAFADSTLSFFGASRHRRE